MRLPKSLIINFVFIIIVFSRCETSRTALRTHNINKSISMTTISWEGRDISSLPIADKPGDIAEIVWIVSKRNVHHGQKKFALRLAQFAHEKDKKNKRIALTLSYAAFILADSEDNKKEKMKYASIGVKAALLAGANNKDPVACYNHALNLGIVVQIKGLFALNKIPVVLKSLKSALKSPGVDLGGPQRTIGMLYLKAPSWPKGIGDLDAALEHLEKAALEYPSHPQNHLFYAEALLEDGDKSLAKKYLNKAMNMAIPEIWGLYYTKRWLKKINYLMKKAS